MWFQTRKCVLSGGEDDMSSKVLKFVYDTFRKVKNDADKTKFTG